MDRLKLGKVETKFFSDKGNNILKRIWLDNGLDEEMIFSSWIGPNKTLMMQNVSDYVQNYLHHRTYLLAIQNDQNDEDAEALYQFKIAQDVSLERRHDYFDFHVRKTLIENYKRREAQERNRVSESIMDGALSPLPGYEHVLKDPIYKALQIERNMLKLSKIPLPFNQDQFNDVILPIIKPVGKERKAKKKCSNKKSLHEELGNNSFTSSATEDIHPSANTSGFIDDYSHSDEHEAKETPSAKHITFESGCESEKSDDGNASVDSGLDFHEKSREIELCDFCGGSQLDEVNFACTCISNQLWADENPKSACSIYEKASEILEKYIRKQLVSTEYMEEYNSTHYKIQ